MGCQQSKDHNPSNADNNNNNNNDDADNNTNSNPFAASTALLNPKVVFQNLLIPPEYVKNALTKKADRAAHHLRNVFALPLEAMAWSTYTPPVFEKTTEKRSFLQQALRQCYVFDDLADIELDLLVSAMEEINVKQGDMIITQGDPGDYFYVVYKGTCEFTVDGVAVGSCQAGASFGELALLYTSPRAASVKATSETVTLFRVDQTTFRYILQSQTESMEGNKIELLKQVEILKDATALDSVTVRKLAAVMTPRPFTAGEQLMHKGEIGTYCLIIQSGTVVGKNITVSGAQYEEVSIGAGGCVGERALVTGEPRVGDVFAKTDGMAFRIDNELFVKVLGRLDTLKLQTSDRMKLGAIKILKDTHLNDRTLASLTKSIEVKTYPVGTKIMVEGQVTKPALYLVRKGKVEIISTLNGEEQKRIVGMDGYFGEEQLLVDKATTTDSSRYLRPATIPATYTVVVIEECTCSILTLESCRMCFDTSFIGQPIKTATDSLVDQKITMKDLKRHAILGAGTFGQVWLVSRESGGTRKAYALKIQSKYELCQDGQAKAVVHEKNIMAQLRSPFLVQLVGAFQDDDFVYMVMGLVQGGELYGIMHTPRRDKLPEKEAKFYVAGIAEGLGYMHRCGYVYRDLKPENVLIGNDGYPVIVDFGFVKYIVDKTYTLCGTPLYLPPEVILNRGHNWGADHWSLGVLLYEMLVGYTPFYKSGMDQSDLFRAIVKCKYMIPHDVSADARQLIMQLLVKDPSKRLGSLAGGEDDITNHAWLSDINMDLLRRREIKPPHVPKVKDPLDSSNFEDWSHLEDKMKTKYPKLTASQQQIFKNF